MAYITQRLHDLAPYYWKRSDTTNCAIRASFSAALLAHPGANIDTVDFPVDMQQMQQAMMRQAAANVFASSSSSRESFSAGVFAGSSSLADQRRGSAPVSGSPMRVVRVRRLPYPYPDFITNRDLASHGVSLDSVRPPPWSP